MNLRQLEFELPVIHFGANFTMYKLILSLEFIHGLGMLTLDQKYFIRRDPEYGAALCL